MPSSKTIKKRIKVDGIGFTLEIYPVRETNFKPEGPFWEIFPDNYHAALFAFSNKEKLNELIKTKYINQMQSVQ